MNISRNTKEKLLPVMFKTFLVQRSITVEDNALCKIATNELGKFVYSQLLHISPEELFQLFVSFFRCVIHAEIGTIAIDIAAVLLSPV
jgi:hypothetical protein